MPPGKAEVESECGPMVCVAVVQERMLKVLRAIETGTRIPVHAISQSPKNIKQPRAVLQSEWWLPMTTII